MKYGTEWLEELQWEGPGFDEVAGWPLVHRTHREQRPSLKSIVETGKLESTPVPTNEEREAGHVNAVYTFLGTASYKKGLIAFLFDPVVTQDLPSSFTPYDSGGVSAGYLKGSDDPSSMFARWCGDGTYLHEISPKWVGSLFDDPLNYVRSVNGTPAPDRQPRTGIQTEGNDAKAWALEVRLHEDVPLAGYLKKVVVAGRGLLELMDPNWDVVFDETATEPTLITLVARVIEEDYAKPIG